MLYIVATPIGNLEDISQRALAVLQKVDAILCEDTRRSSVLLQRYSIQKPLFSYDKFKEKSTLSKILNDLQSGKNLALISDAGTPCINDPGYLLIKACIEHKIPFTAIPGACSPILALLLSGMDPSRFQCIGFLAKKGKTELRQALAYPGTTIAFESPERIIATLQSIHQMDPDRQLAICREMTKVFEECLRGTAKTLIAHFQTQAKPKGEITLVIEKGAMPEEEMPLDELIDVLQTLHGLSLKEAIKLAAKLKKIPKTLAYGKFHRIRS